MVGFEEAAVDGPLLEEIIVGLIERGLVSVVPLKRSVLVIPDAFVVETIVEDGPLLDESVRIFVRGVVVNGQSLVVLQIQSR